jgi:flagellar basal-body rod protein FlgB
MIQPSEDRVFPALEDLLSWTSRRQQALAANIANQDTPGYRAKDYSFSFEEQLNSLTMTTTDEKHMMPLEDTPKTRLYEVGTEEKLNGNTVDLEREMSEITKNGLQYITLIQYLSQKIKTMRYAITEGGKG